jgi:hypothetical protein
MRFKVEWVGEAWQAEEVFTDHIPNRPKELSIMGTRVGGYLAWAI